MPLQKLRDGPIDVVADQQMIAGLQHREQGGGDRRQARGRDADAGALRAFQRHQRVLQRPGGRRAVAAILELAAMGMQVLGGRIEHGGTVDHRRIDESLLRLGVAAGGHQPGFGLLRVDVAVSPGRFHAFAATKDVLPQPRRSRRPAGRQVRAGFVNNRTQKTAVNPLTRLASRSVMRAELFSRRTLRGLPRPSIHRLTELRVRPPVRLTAFGEWIIGLAHSACATTMQRSRTTLERLCP